MSLGGGSQSSSSKTKIPAFAKKGGRSLNKLFQNAFFGSGELANQSRTALSSPMGIIGSQYQNLFGDDPSSDFLGARAALQNALSGDALQNYYGQAFDVLQPGMNRNIELMKQNVLSGTAGLGNRFSSDVMNQQRAGAQDIMLGTQQQALGSAMDILGQQMGGALGVYDQVGGLAEGQMGRQIPLWVSMVTGAPTTSQSSSSGWNMNLGI